MILLEGSIQGDKELSVYLGVSADHIKDFRKPLNEISREVLKSFDLNFDARGGLFGGWPPRKRSYPWPLLEKTGAMRMAFVSSVSSNEAIFGNTATYFKYHQSNEQRSKLPRRVMIKLDETRKEFAIKAMQQHIVNSTRP